MDFDIDDWKILALGRKKKRLRIVDELKRQFTCSDWYWSERTYDMTVFYTPTGQEAKVSLGKVEYPSANDPNAVTYYVAFDPLFLGFRPKAEKAHQDFFWEIYHKISWEKQGIWFKDGKQIPIPREKILRMK